MIEISWKLQNCMIIRMNDSDILEIIFSKTILLSEFDLTSNPFYSYKILMTDSTVP